MSKKKLVLKFLLIVAIISSAFAFSSCFTTIGLVSCKKSCQESCNSSEIYVSGHEYGIYYTLDDSGEFYWVSEVGYKETDVKIPEAYEGYPVMGIKHRAFEHYRQTGSCGGGYYFGMHLSSLTLPKTVKIIDIGVFGGGIDHNYHTEVATCDKLIYEGTIGDWCDMEFRSKPFYDGTKLYIDGELLTDLVIPEDVTKINENAFAYYNWFDSVTLHENITEIGENAFEGSNIKSITFPCKDLTILQAAFFGCNQLEAVTFTGENLVLADDSIFAWCSALKEVEWNTVRITEITECTFAGCYSLESFAIPSSVEVIENRAFDGCYNLVEVYNLSKLNVLAGSTTHGGVAQYAGVVHTAEGEGGSILTVGDYKFAVSDAGVTLFKYTGDGGALNLPVLESGENYGIRREIFSGNDNILSVNIPACVTDIGDRAFANCFKLKIVSGCEGLVNIGVCAFANCNKLESVTLVVVENIEYGAFINCPALNSISLPETLKQLGSGSLGDDNAKITYAGTLEEWLAVELNAGATTDVTVTCSDGEVWEGKI